MDYEMDLDLMADVCVLDVDLPTFLDDYQLLEDRPFGNIDGDFANLTNEKTYAVNDFDGINYNLSKGDGPEPFPSLLCTQNSPEKNQIESHQRQNESPSSYLAPWHENFVDVEGKFGFTRPETVQKLVSTEKTRNMFSETNFLIPRPVPRAHEGLCSKNGLHWYKRELPFLDEFNFFDLRPTTETTSFLQNVLWQAETERSVEDFLDIVDQSASKNTSKMNAIQDPQQIFEEIYRECNQIVAESPRLVSESEFGEGVVEVLEYYSPSVGISTNGAESDDDSMSRISNYTPGSMDGSESTFTTETNPDLDHTFAAAKKFTKKNALTVRRGSSTKKKVQNRVAASRYRCKKKSERVMVESEVSVLEGRNVQLKTTVVELEREITYLKGFLSEIRAVKGGKKKKQIK